MGGNGRTESRIKLIVKTPGSSLRNVAPKVGVSAQTVSNIMKHNGYKSYHRWRTQKLSDTHKVNRVRSAKALLQKYGKHYRDGRSWSKVVNTDFSAKIKISPSRNSKNDVVWALNREDGGDLLTAPKEKFSQGEMIWGGVCSKGLVPSDRPIFVSELVTGYIPKPKTLNSEKYSRHD